MGIYGLRGSFFSKMGAKWTLCPAERGGGIGEVTQSPGWARATCRGPVRWQELGAGWHAPWLRLTEWESLCVPQGGGCWRGSHGRDPPGDVSPRGEAGWAPAGAQWPCLRRRSLNWGSLHGPPTALCSGAEFQGPSGSDVKAQRVTPSAGLVQPQGGVPPRRPPHRQAREAEKGPSAASEAPSQRRDEASMHTAFPGGCERSEGDVHWS